MDGAWAYLVVFPLVALGFAGIPGVGGAVIGAARWYVRRRRPARPTSRSRTGRPKTPPGRDDGSVAVTGGLAARQKGLR